MSDFFISESGGEKISQAGGRNKITSFEQWVEMDLRYIDNWSLWLDIKILIRTVPAVLLGRGAN